MQQTQPSDMIRLLILCCLILGRTIVCAQNNDVITVPGSSNYNISASDSLAMILSQPDKGKTVVSVYVPVFLTDGTFKQVSNNMWGSGLGLAVLYNPFSEKINTKTLRPFLVGGEMSYVWFAYTTDYTRTYVSGYEYEVRNKVNTGAFSFGYIGRVEFLGRTVYPILIYQAGLRFFDGSQKISFTALNNNNQPVPSDISNILQGSVAAYVGYGGGLGISLGTLRIEAKLIQQLGSRARYIEPGSIVLNSNQTVTYTTKKSTTNLIIPQFGVSIMF